MYNVLFFIIVFFANFLLMVVFLFANSSKRKTPAVRS